jgi:protein-S-isoprenylcysteine O-methyltransferase Ste14
MHLWLRALLFALLAPGTVAGLVPYLLGRLGGPRLEVAAMPVVGAALVAAGAAGLAWCFALFVRVGRGTPAPYDPPVHLVTAGPYRWSRNPMYVAVLLVTVGIAGLTGSVLVAGYAVLLTAIFHLRVRLYEEPRLRHQFGRDYDDYQAAVPRWLGLRPSRSRATHVE